MPKIFSALPLNAANGEMDALEGTTHTPDQALEKKLVSLLLCQAARSGDISGLQLVLQEFSHLVNVPDYDGRTPLHVAGIYEFI